MYFFTGVLMHHKGIYPPAQYLYSKNFLAILKLSEMSLWQFSQFKNLAEGNYKAFYKVIALFSGFQNRKF